MILSPAERSYLYDSLTASPVIRPDGRKHFQFRPLEAKIDFLPGSNGSARIRMTDGSECIVSVKSKVVLIAKEDNLIECDVDLAGFRDDSNFVSNLKFSLTDLFTKNFPTEKLHLTSKYAYKLFVDCIVISHSSYPLTLITFCAYLALKATKLPLLTSEIDDSEIEEQPTFSDDWEKAQTLAEVFNLPEFQPPLIITVGVIGENLIVDPTETEEQVLENGLLLGWYNNTVIAPITNMNLATSSNNANFKGINSNLLVKAISLLSSHCSSLISEFDKLAEEDSADNDGSIF
ncbi:hypothetical protein OXX69_010797 [Metschnikowia pulcherrima]